MLYSAAAVATRHIATATAATFCWCMCFLLHLHYLAVIAHVIARAHTGCPACSRRCLAPHRVPSMLLLLAHLNSSARLFLSALLLPDMRYHAVSCGIMRYNAVSCVIMLQRAVCCITTQYNVSCTNSKTYLTQWCCFWCIYCLHCCHWHCCYHMFSCATKVRAVATTVALLLLLVVLKRLTTSSASQQTLAQSPLQTLSSVLLLLPMRPVLRRVLLPGGASPLCLVGKLLLPPSSSLVLRCLVLHSPLPTSFCHICPCPIRSNPSLHVCSRLALAFCPLVLPLVVVASAAHPLIVLSSPCHCVHCTPQVRRIAFLWLASLHPPRPRW